MLFRSERERYVIISQNNVIKVAFPLSTTEKPDKERANRKNMVLRNPIEGGGKLVKNPRLF